jgi:PhzF family phenazine biosynthesis protein
MPSIRYQQLDVFAARPGGGNQLGVVIDAHDWSDPAMQAFARWTNLVETTFLAPASVAGASYRVRIFTPTREIPFAGHPTLGSAHAALAHGLAVPDARGLIWQECGAGVLPIRVEQADGRQRLFVQAPRARLIEPMPDAAQLHALLQGVALGALPPAFIEGGRRWWLAEFADEAALRQWQPDHAAIARLAKATDSLGLCAFARSNEPGVDLVVRALASGVGIVEDPASGAANGLIAQYVAMREPEGPLGKGYRVSQGREVGHDAAIVIRYEDGGTWVGGHTNVIISGTVDWPHARA